MTKRRNIIWLRDPRVFLGAVLFGSIVAGLIKGHPYDKSVEAGTVTAVRNDTAYVAIGYTSRANRAIYLDNDSNHRKLYEFLRPGDLLKYKNTSGHDTLKQTPEIISVNARKYPEFLNCGMIEFRRNHKTR